MIPARKVLQETRQISCFTRQGFCKIQASLFSRGGALFTIPSLLSMCECTIQNYVILLCSQVGHQKLALLQMRSTFHDSFIVGYVQLHNTKLCHITLLSSWQPKTGSFTVEEHISRFCHCCRLRANFWPLTDIFICLLNVKLDVLKHE